MKSTFSFWYDGDSYGTIWAMHVEFGTKMDNKRTIYFL